jgi:hypothetical protein
VQVYVYIVAPDGTVIWEPTPDDYVFVHEEESDIVCRGGE